MAEVIKAEVTVSKEAYEAGLAIGKLFIDIKKMLADGAGIDDIPKAMATLMSAEVLAGIQGIEKLGDEMKENKAAFIAAFTVAGVKIAEQI